MYMTKTKYLLLLSLFLLPFSLAAQTRIFSSKLDGKNKGLGKGKQETSYGLHTSQYDGVHHLVGMYVDGGYATFLTKNPAVVNPLWGGYTAGLGASYSYHNGTIIVQTGLGVRWQHVFDSVAVLPLTYDINYTQGSQSFHQQLIYTQTSRQDQSLNLYLEVPLMVGSYFGGGFYFLVGPKFLLQLYGSTRINTVMTTTAEYPDHFVGTYGQMTNHGLRDHVDLAATGPKLNLTFDLAASAELGYEFPMSNKGKRGYRKQNQMDRRVRLAAFADFGVLNMRQNSQLPATVIPAETRYDFQTFQFHHIFSDPESTSAIHNLFAGIRLTFFFYGYQSKEPCLQCGVRGAQRPW